MKTFLMISIIMLFLNACSDNTEHLAALETKIHELESKLNDSYKPGFGEFMSNIQVHHAKLWFAGKNHNWQLADFEIHEIKESLQDLEKYQTERVETKSLPMIYPVLERVSDAIEKKISGNLKLILSH